MRIFLIIFVVYATTADASLWSHLCGALGRLRPSEAAAIDSAIRKGLLREGWREDRGAAILVDQAGSVAPAERARLIAGFVEEKSRGELLHLALYEPAAWDRFIDRIGSEGLGENHFFQSLQPAVEKMPTELKDHLSRKIGRLFDRVEKKTPGRTSPRRAFEAFLRAAYPADKFVAARVKAGATPLQAMGEFQAMMRDKVYAGTERTAYATEDIGATALATWQTLRNSGTAHGAQLTLYGSFINGFAAKGSDLDIMTFDASHKVLAAPINENVAKYLAHRGTHVSAKIDPDTFFVSYMQPTMATYSPFMIEVKENDLTLLVYPAKIGRGDDDQERVVAEPLRYSLLPRR